MKQFIIRIIAFTVLLYFITLCFDKIVTTGLRQNETKHFNTLSKINQGQLNVDLMINGSSKAVVQVDPIIMDSILGVNSYNFGLDGTPFIPQRAQYELYRLKNTKPKIIIQIVSNGTLRSLNEGFNLPIKFAPYLDIPEVKNQIKLTSSFSYSDYTMPMSRYSGKSFEIITGALSFCGIQYLKTNDVKGYAPNTNSWPEDSQKAKDSEQTDIDEKIEVFTSLDSVSCKSFESFLANCKTENIIVFLVYPPIYEDDFNSIKHVNYYNKIAQEYNAHFLDYSQDSLLAFNQKYFYNSQHLNIEGATLFTTKLSEEIKTRIHNTVSYEKELN